MNIVEFEHFSVAPAVSLELPATSNRNPVGQAVMPVIVTLAKGKPSSKEPSLVEQSIPSLNLNCGYQRMPMYPLSLTYID
jgi:hypothetical protein